MQEQQRQQQQQQHEEHWERQDDEGGGGGPPPPISAYGFRNVRALTRPERLALKDKVAREKQRLFNVSREGLLSSPVRRLLFSDSLPFNPQRAGHQAKMYRENLPPEGVSLTEAHPGAVGFISDADRFHTDTVGEELQNRMAEHEKKLRATEFRRSQAEEREGARQQWSETNRRAEEERVTRMREEGLKGRANKSAVPYDTITLQYNDGLDGQRLQHEDGLVRYRAAVRSNNLRTKGNTRGGFNIITGEPLMPLSQPVKPQKPAALEAAVVPLGAAYR
jgi:hypothetical protein